MEKKVETAEILGITRNTLRTKWVTMVGVDEMHITLYRKYRPKNFEEIAGQKEIVKTLKASLRMAKLLTHIFSQVQEV